VSFEYEYEYDNEDAWQAASRRRRYMLVTFVTVAAVVFAVGVAVVAFTMAGRSGQADAAAPAAVESSASSAAASDPASATEAPPSPTPSPSVTRSPSARPKPTRSLAPPKETRLPPPPPPPAPPGCTPTYRGSPAPKAQVKAALDAAAAHQFWGSEPRVKIPTRLLYAVGWQESGWQSTIIACDKGIGTMQVMPDTATWMNQRFGTSWDVYATGGNAMLGGQYLAWLTKYFGDQLNTGGQANPYDLGAADTTLLDAVVSAYNVGFGNVNLALGHDGIVNWQYVNNVKALMINCPCLAA
jgi:soluble lytic murein transglycosylase-like protein